MPRAPTANWPFERVYPNQPCILTEHTVFTSQLACLIVMLAS